MYLIYSVYIIYIIYKYTQIGKRGMLLYSIHAIMKKCAFHSSQQWFCSNSCNWTDKFVSACIFGN